MDLTIYKNGKKIIDNGKEVCDKNEFFKDLYEIMSKPEFRNFIDKYFKNITDTQTVLGFINQWKQLEDGFKERYDENLNPLITIYMLHYIWTDGDFRRKLESNKILK